MYEAENAFIDSLIADINHLKAENESLKNSKRTFKAKNKKLKAKIEELKTRLEKQDKLIDDFIDHLAWEDAKFAAFEAGVGNPSVGAVSQYRKPYEEILQELKEKGE